jgi:hypothetical protein
MKNVIYLLLLLLVASCNPINNPNTPTKPVIADSVFVCADFRKYGDYYKTGHQVYAIDLLSQGLEYDSLFHIQGSGYNLFLSDIFTTSKSLPAGHYQMDSVAKDMTFLRGMDFEGSITGTYLLQISENKIQRITLFTGGSMDVAYLEDEILLDFKLYTADSTLYHATYQGPAMYR